MPGVAALARLSATLVSLYPGQSDARALADRAGLNLGNIDLSGPPRVYLWNVVKEAANTGRLAGLLGVALEDYPGHPDLLRAQDDDYDRLTAPVPEPVLPASRWQPGLSMARAEKLMGSVSTFLPVSFLALGAERARSVARVILPDLSTGSGFLVARNLLVTNHHVLPDAETARSARVQFNFQESSTGQPEQIEELGLDPDSVFLSSPMDGGHDYAVVQVAGTPNDRWGALPLAEAGPAVGSRVMIVQHPEGGFKKIALYNNLVTYSDDDVVQYYTDTLPGSSGSPVLDQTWRVVAVHHAGGDLVEPASGRRVFRNEGITIARIVTAMKEAGVL